MEDKTSSSHSFARSIPFLYHLSLCIASTSLHRCLLDLLQAFFSSSPFSYTAISRLIPVSLATSTSASAFTIHHVHITFHPLQPGHPDFITSSYISSNPLPFRRTTFRDYCNFTSHYTYSILTHPVLAVVNFLCIILTFSASKSSSLLRFAPIARIVLSSP